MRRCPKCSSFYDDGQLRFCLKDGVPLIDVDQPSSIWNEGATVIRETQRRTIRETRIQQLKKVVSMLITTVLTIMVISVITLNSWIYMSEPEKEIVQKVAPSPSNTPESSPEPTGTDSPTPSPTATRTRTPTPTPTPTPETCSLEKRQTLERQIEAQKATTWREEFVKDKNRFIETKRPELLRDCEMLTKSAPACKAFGNSTNAILGETPARKSIVKAANDCKGVTATVTFLWTVTMSHMRPRTFSQEKTFTYPVK